MSDTASEETEVQETDAPEESDDFDAQAALAAAQEADEQDSDDDLDPKIKAELHKRNRENQALRAKNKELLAAQKRLKELEDKDKSESTRLTEERDQLKAELRQLTVDKVRRDAAAEANLPAKFARFITAEDEDDALAQAKELAKELGLDAKGNKRSPDLRQGNRGPANAGAAKTDPDELLRAMARR